ncbi:MAG TPA: nucleotidyl transferase AbiEii/AbiGii toxin family protein [Polyangiaceae bacterium]|jgi:hypothetical protein|nr:nucleotidyl transferase AbiEii/AbiGii toxin family protein [Polyangiaceae bacterium]
MPGKSARGNRLLEDALEALARALTESGAPWMVIGGIAIIARGVRRFTTDIDATVRGDAVRPEKVVEALRSHGIAPRIDDALSFARVNLVLLVRHEPTGVDLDVSFGWSAFEHEALATCTLTKFGSVRIPVCTPENLVVFKAIAGRPKDAEDAEALLALYPEIDIARVRKRVAELSALAEAPELLTGFDTLAAAARPAATSASRATRPTRVARPVKKRRRRRK